MPRYAYPICKHTCRVDYLLKEDTKMRTCVFRQDTTPSTHGKYEAAKYALPLLPRVFAPARCSIEHQPVYKIPIIKILVGVFARARAMEKYEERSPRTFYQALEDGTCRGFYIRFLCSDCEKLNRIRTLFFYRNWYLIYFRVLMTKLYTSCPIENFEKLRKGEASNRPLCLRMLKEKERGRQKSPDLVRILLLYVQLPTDVFKVHSPTEPKSNACQRRQCYSYICMKA